MLLELEWRNRDSNSAMSLNMNKKMRKDNIKLREFSLKLSITIKVLLQGLLTVWTNSWSAKTGLERWLWTYNRQRPNLSTVRARLRVFRIKTVRRRKMTQSLRPAVMTVNVLWPMRLSSFQRLSNRVGASRALKFCVDSPRRTALRISPVTTIEESWVLFAQINSKLQTKWQESSNKNSSRIELRQRDSSHRKSLVKKASNSKLEIKGSTKTLAIGVFWPTPISTHRFKMKWLLTWPLKKGSPTTITTSKPVWEVQWLNAILSRITEWLLSKEKRRMQLSPELKCPPWWASKTPQL